MFRELTEINQEILVSDFSQLVCEDDNKVTSKFSNTNWESFIIVLQVKENFINIFINESVFDEVRHSFRIYTEVFNNSLVLKTNIGNISRIFKIYDKIFDEKEVDTVYIDEKNSLLSVRLRKC